MHEHNIEPHSRSFQVTFSQDADPKAVWALKGLAQQYPGVCIEETGSIDERTIKSPDLKEVSRMLWGEVEHGEFANGYLNALRCTAPSEVVRYPDNTLGFSSDGGRLFGLPGKGAGFLPESAGRDISQHLAPLFKCSALPFDIQVAKKRNPSPGVLCQMSPGVATRGKLRNYLRHSGLDQHALHGTLGKGLDVLLHASGVRPPSRVDREYVGSTLLRSRLSTIMDEMELTNGKRQDIFSPIQALLRKQLITGKPAERGEIVVIGKSTEINANMRVRWERIAVSSVDTLIQILKERNNRSAVAVLKQFIG